MIFRSFARLVTVVFLSIIFIALGFLSYKIPFANAAISINDATNLINFNNQTINASSSPTAIIGLNLASSAETLTSINISLQGASGFATSTDLAGLSTATSSGLAIYRDNKSGGIVGLFDSTDIFLPLSSNPVWTATTTTLTLTNAETVPTNDSGNNFGDDYFIVAKTGAGAVNGHSFTLSLYPGDIGYSASTPTTTPTTLTTSAMTIDTIAPTVDASNTNPSNGATNIPIDAFIRASFSENIDASTVNVNNISLSTGGSPVDIAFRTMPNAFNVIVSNPPTYATSSLFVCKSFRNIFWVL